MPGFSMQGKVSIGRRQANGVPGILRELGNASVVRLELGEDVEERSESMTGNRLPLRRLTRARTGTLSITFDEGSTENLALGLRALVTDVAAGTAVTGYTFPTGAAVGSVLVLPAKNVSAVALKDSTGSPKTLTANTNYELDAFAGTIKLLDLAPGGPYVQPFKADYTPGAHRAVGAFTDGNAEYYIRVDGFNTDDAMAREVGEIFRVRISPTRALDLINEGYQDFELTGTVLADLTRAANSAGGQYYAHARAAA